MNIYQQGREEDIVDSITRMLEHNTGKKIFTFKVLEQNEKGLDAVIVFDDKSVMMGLISVQEIEGKLACRLQGNYI